MDAIKDFHHRLCQMKSMWEGLKANYRAHQMIRILCVLSLLSSWFLVQRANWAFGHHRHLDIEETAFSLYMIAEGIGWHQRCRSKVATSRFVLVKKKWWSKTRSAYRQLPAWLYEGEQLVVMLVESGRRLYLDLLIHHVCTFFRRGERPHPNCLTYKGG